MSQRENSNATVERVKREAALALCIKTIIKYASKDYLLKSIEVEGNKIYFTDESNKKQYIIIVTEL